ncbi:MAG: radical SAM protein [Humidesulfovibrio sp.]|uniref:radical SAM protein n=1 Tax=Humidesulfovibrio sp. TaxID=2910988 RepID=UPI0027F14F73|nr:radical SAM protein [Humidesulfovibrio sp.]MDQ7835616.1 radical SAM protein [Humidesulfovibrio sp.]
MSGNSLEACRICPRACGVDRTRKPGLCGMGATVRVALAQLHVGEEPVLSGTTSLAPQEARGSGTIFFCGCSLRCVYCQNHDICLGGPECADKEGDGPNGVGPNGGGPGHDLSVDDLTALMLELELAGAHNVNLVTPTHFTPPLREALTLARNSGLTIPVVWNSSAYETVESLRSLEGLVDIFLPDLRYMDATAAARYSAAPDYPEVATAAIAEMHRQVGRLVVEDGIARRGLLIRLLVLPGNAGRADLALDWIAENLGTDTAVSLMGQYYPAHRASEFPEINRCLKPIEYAAVRRHMERLGFSDGFVQEVGSSAAFTPDFRRGG